MALIALKAEAAVKDWILIAFVCASLSLLSSTIAFLLDQIRLIEGCMKSASGQHKLQGAAEMTFLVGLSLFLVGVGMLGWVHSVFLGVVSAVGAVLAVVMVLWSFGVMDE